MFALLQVFHTVCTIFDEGVTSFVRLFQLLLLLLLKKTDLTCRKRASRTGYKVSRNSTTKYRGECSYRLYEWLKS